METALALRPQTALEAFTPRSLEEAFKLAQVYAASKLLGTSYGTPEQVMVVMATGAALGIDAMASLRSIYVVEGRTFLSADLMVALCLRSSVCQRFSLVEQSNEAAAYTVQRRGEEPLTFRFTLEDAQRAGLGMRDNSNWKKYPRRMLIHRAATEAARTVFPDVVLGMECGERGMVDLDEPERSVAPLVAAKPAPAVVVEAELAAESDEARVLRLFSEAQTAEQVSAAAEDARRTWPTGRPEAVKAAYLAAKARCA